MKHDHATVYNRCVYEHLDGRVYCDYEASDPPDCARCGAPLVQDERDTQGDLCHECADDPDWPDPPDGRDDPHEWTRHQRRGAGLGGRCEEDE